METYGLEKLGITGIKEIVYNPSYEQLFEAEMDPTLEGYEKGQMTELGAVDAGGGGTVAKFIGNLGIDTVDVGVPVLSMHAPYELISKADVYSLYKACLAFIK